MLDGQMYALINGGCPSWANPTAISGVYLVNDDASLELVANLTEWLPANPVENMTPDIGSDGSLFDLKATSDALVLSVADYGEILRVTPEGEISRIVDLSVMNLTPTGIAVDSEDNLYVGFETIFPFVDGTSKVVMITPDGTVTNHWTGLTAVLDVEFGPDDVLYAVQLAVGNTDEAPYFAPNSGQVVRMTGSDSHEVVVSDAPPPTFIGFSGDGMLHVALPAFGENSAIGLGALIALDPDAGPVVACRHDVRADLQSVERAHLVFRRSGRVALTVRPEQSWHCGDESPVPAFRCAG